MAHTPGASRSSHRAYSSSSGSPTSSSRPWRPTRSSIRASKSSSAPPTTASQTTRNATEIRGKTRSRRRKRIKKQRSKETRKHTKETLTQHEHTETQLLLHYTQAAASNLQDNAGMVSEGP